MTTDRERFRAIISEFHTALLVTHAANEYADLPPRSTTSGPLSARPMAISRIDPNCDLWFMTGVDTSVIHEIAVEPRVQVVAQQGDSKFIAVSGSARVLHDPAKVRELWKEPYKVWFPDGPQDPTIRLIHVAAQTGEFWDVQGKNRLTYLFETAKAYVTGTKAPQDPEQHDKIQL